MHKFTVALLLLILAATFTELSAQNRVITKGNKAYLSNTLIVKIKQTNANTLNKSAGITQIFQRVLKTANINVSKTFKSSAKAFDEIYTLNYDSYIDPELLAAKLSKSKEILWAEPKYLSRIDIIPDDPNYGFQNYLKKIQAEEAWDVTEGDSTIIIAIIDTGIDWDHPDLAANMWINNDELPNNSIDDDNNGYIDDYRGWDFGGLNGVADNDPREDDPDHGTHVAGLASAVTNNGVGIASLGYRSKLMPVKSSTDSYRDQFGNPYVVYGYEAITYAADNGAHIVNCSWGNNSFSRLGEDVINYAISKGVLVIGASGNDNTSDDHFPSGYNGVISVTSVNQNDVRSTFSNYGEGVDISVQGENIYSTWQNDTYATLSGTSMSAPIVAGLAALVKSRFPTYSPIQLGEQIRVNATPIDDLNNSYRRKLGYGRVNALNAVSNQASKSVRAYDITFSDQTSGANGNNIFENGELVEVTIKFRNILNPTTALQVKLENASTHAQISNPDFSIGTLNTMDSVTHVFQFTINNNAPSDYRLTFTLNYTDNGYTDYQWLGLTINPTYYTQEAGNVKLTITSKGTFGFNDYPDNVQGEGFTYRNSNNMLFEGAFITGTANTKVADGARAADQNNQDDDFKVLRPFVISTPGPAADQQGFGIFNDDNAGTSRIGLETHQNSYSYALIPYNDFVILRYDMINTSGAAIANLFAGVFLDWDLVDGSNDRTGYNAEHHFGYVTHNGQDTVPVTGTALISSDKYNFYAIQNNGEDSGFGIYDGFTDAEKWQAISGGISKSTAGPEDISFVVGGGPFEIAVNDTLSVAFVVAAHDSLAGLRDAIIASRTKYLNILTDVTQNDAVAIKYDLAQNYPNPFNPSTRITWSIAEAGQVTITIYDILGNKVKQIVNEFKPAGLYSTSFDASNLASGVYIYKLQTPKFQSAKKMILIR